MGKFTLVMLYGLYSLFWLLISAAMAVWWGSWWPIILAAGCLAAGGYIVFVWAPGQK